MTNETKWILTIVCSIVLIAVIVWKVNAIRKARKALVERPGIISNWLSTMKGNQQIFKPVIKFIGLDGTQQELPADDDCEGAPEYAIGTNVMVKINPKKPDFISVIYP
jgi:hypothetical protein